jgi:hypothetical protein
MAKPLFASTLISYFERESRRMWGIESINKLEARWNRICDAIERNAAQHANWGSEKRFWRKALAKSVRNYVRQECSWARFVIQTLQAQ